MAGGKSSGSAITALVLGILSIVCCPLILGIPAIILGNKAIREIDANPSLEGRGMAKAGVVLGWVSIVLFVVGVLLQIVFGIALIPIANNGGY